MMNLPSNIKDGTIVITGENEELIFNGLVGKYEVHQRKPNPRVENTIDGGTYTGIDQSFRYTIELELYDPSIQSLDLDEVDSVIEFEDEDFVDSVSIDSDDSVLDSIEKIRSAVDKRMSDE